ncbi:uncharacterized protein LY89DRAFT_717393 [Mollisia scopiformis]|uniref:Uncharacterized protein n=1 Tax=Mollisia scopiformis TaxID=149040 RepID=A0A194XFA5_MOLSC|nr:uncharacterized protein LY89DRAFT_717393 [Mollisia scopiformis]KUJ18875.1 hypothetical protein LY89DRAFT_717393 [Mollisia scopiformis]
MATDTESMGAPAASENAEATPTTSTKRGRGESENETSDGELEVNSSRKANRASKKVKGNVEKRSTLVADTANTLTSYEEGKTFEQQPAAIQQELKRVLELGNRYRQAIEGLPEYARRLLIQQESTVALLKPFTTVGLREEMSYVIIEAMRHIDEGGEMKRGEERKKAAIPFAQQAFSGMFDARGNKRQARPAGSVAGLSLKEAPKHGDDEEFDNFISNCGKYIEATGPPRNYSIKRTDAWKVYHPFHCMNIRKMMSRMLLELEGAWSQAIQSGQATNDGEGNDIKTYSTSSAGVAILDVNINDTSSLQGAFRQSARNVKMSQLQHAYLQMAMAKHLRDCYDEYKKKADNNGTEKLPQNRKEEKDQGLPTTDWIEEVRVGNRWRRWSEILCGQEDEFGVLLTLGFFTMPTGGPDFSFLHRKINNDSMEYAEAYIEMYTPELKTLCESLNVEAPAFLRNGFISPGSIAALQSAVDDIIPVDAPAAEGSDSDAIGSGMELMA